MLELFIEPLSLWNPQLVRELKSRLNWLNIAIVTVISIIMQWITFTISGLICIYNSPKWWLNLSELLDKEIWLVLAIGGIFSIAQDFDREMRSGTLNIVKLSPAKPLEIVVGKLIGVPILIYWAVFLALPLDVVASIRVAEIAPHDWIGDLVSVIQIGLLYLYALVGTMRFPLPSIVLSVILSAIGGLSLFSIERLLLVRQNSGEYVNLGIHSSEYWWMSGKIVLMFVISYFVLVSLIRTWYPRSRFDRQKSSYTMLLPYFSSLIFPVLIAGAQPIGMLVFIVIALNVIIKAHEIT
ncbi:hypothetical protein [Chamaesiphon minutus]|uniref:Uncharacterized protein n=1 Tax=Chamaesiphon minutus (strain ATCC 27169 / PCC 6605) TaxID=1173020 RepID=K9UH11_CHAP6|nr:hypothetical protein [Chamaesiphon minutus]AFY93933.1 hypothetical protein Cha6605_2900 [Chamaesiphon minutus PCC 6605]